MELRSEKQNLVGQFRHATLLHWHLVQQNLEVSLVVDNLERDFSWPVYGSHFRALFKIDSRL